MIHRLDLLRKKKPGDCVEIPEPHRPNQGKYLKSIVYGGLDGIITTFAVVTGVAGASLSPKVILILGAANLFADGIAMAFGDFLSTKAENDYHASERDREEWEVENYPQSEREELIDIYLDKGIKQSDAEFLVDILSRYPKAMVDTMMIEELGILEDGESPLGNAIATFLSFVFFGSFPLLIYFIGQFAGDSQLLVKHSLLIACSITAITLFTLGAVKARVTGQNRIISGGEMLLIGGLAAGVAYGIGALLEGLIPG